MRLYKKKNEQEVKNNAILYFRGKDRTNELSKYFIDSLNNEVESLFNRFVNSTTNVFFVDGQPYENVQDMKKDLFENNTLLISKDFNDSPIFTKSNNLKNRALHDFLHCLLDAPFTYEGEKKVCKYTLNIIIFAY